MNSEVAGAVIRLTERTGRMIVTRAFDAVLVHLAIRRERTLINALLKALQEAGDE